MEMSIFSKGAKSELNIRDFYRIERRTLAYALQLTSNFRKALERDEDYCGWEAGTPLPNIKLMYEFCDKEFILCAVFEGLSKLKSIDLSQWDTTGVARLVDLFAGCVELETIVLDNMDLSLWGRDLDAQLWVNGNFMFCNNLKTISIENTKLTLGALEFLASNGKVVGDPTPVVDNLEDLIQFSIFLSKSQ